MDLSSLVFACKVAGKSPVWITTRPGAEQCVVHHFAYFPSSPRIPAWTCVVMISWRHTYKVNSSKARQCIATLHRATRRRGPTAKDRFPVSLNRCMAWPRLAGWPPLATHIVPVAQGIWLHSNSLRSERVHAGAYHVDAQRATARAHPRRRVRR